MQHFRPLLRDAQQPFLGQNRVTFGTLLPSLVSCRSSNHRGGKQEKPGQRRNEGTRKEKGKEHNLQVYTPVPGHLSEDAKCFSNAVWFEFFKIL